MQRWVFRWRSCRPSSGTSTSPSDETTLQPRMDKGLCSIECGSWASARKNLAATPPKLPKRRPRPPAPKTAARTKKRLAAQGAALFTHRYLFVQRHLHKTKRKTLWHVSRGLPQLRALRAVMDQVYALFDRRCRTQTALAKLAKLRRRLQRCPQLGETLKKLFAPTLEKALTLLDDKRSEERR